MKTGGELRCSRTQRMSYCIVELLLLFHFKSVVFLLYLRQEEHMISPRLYSGVRGAQSFVFCVVFCRSMFILFFQPFHCLSFDLWSLIIPLWYLQTFLINSISNNLINSISFNLINSISNNLINSISNNLINSISNNLINSISNNLINSISYNLINSISNNLINSISNNLINCISNNLINSISYNLINCISNN